MGDPFARLTSSVLARLGKDAVLRGENVDPPRKVNIEHGVQVQIDGDEYAVYSRSIATIAAADAPKVNDTLSHPDGEFVLDALYGENGQSLRFVLRKAVA